MAKQDEFFQAMQTIVDASIANVKFDKTIKATIIDDTKAEDGEYRLDNGSMEFTAYSDNVTYRKGNIVYVTIPGGDVTQQKLITGKYIAGEKETATFVTPSETFMDITGNIFSSKNSNIVELTANGSEHKVVISNAIPIHEVGYNRLLIRCNVRTWLKSYNLLQGNYGIRVDIIEKEQTTLTSSREVPHSYYLDCKDMYGDMYNYETYYTQEILCDISNLTGTIESISLTAYQLGNFKNEQGIIGCDDSIKNIYLTNFYVSFGFDLTGYNGESVLLYTSHSKTYSDQFTDLMKQYYDINDDDGPLTEKEMSGYIQRYNNKDLKIRWLVDDAEDSLYPVKVVSSTSNTPEGTVIHVYRWVLGEGVADELAGAFWQEIEEYKNHFEIFGFTPDSTKEFEKLKVIIESPSRASMREKLEADQDYIELLGKNQSDAGVKSLIESLENEYMSQVQFFESNELEFRNESDVIDYTSLDLITGLNIEVDTNGYNGVYMVYEDSGEIAAASEATKRRVLNANYTSLVSGDKAADVAEKITWVIPLVNTMIETPEYGIEFDAVLERKGNTNIWITKSGSDEVIKYEDRIEITRTGVAPSVGMGEYEDGSAQQLFRIKRQFNPNFTNNTIECRLVKNRKTYSAVTSLSFGPKGIQGTDYSFILEYETGETALPLIENYTAIVRPRIFNADHTDITYLFRDAVFDWSWYNRRIDLEKDGIEIITADMTEHRAKLKVKSTDWDECSFYILKCTVKGMIPLANQSSEQKLTLTTYLPIAIKQAGFDRLALDGPINIKYDTTGTKPTFYNKDYELLSNLTTIGDDGNPTIVEYPVGWRMVFGDDCEGAEKTDTDNGNAYKFYPHVSEDGKLTVPSIYLTSGMGTKIMVEGYINPHKDTTKVENGKNVTTRTYQDTWTYNNWITSVDEEGNTGAHNQPITYDKGYVLWRQPLRIFIEKYGSPLLNSWDGNLTIDEENGIILSAMMGAGIKNPDNSFSGVLMGDVSKAYNQNASGPLARYYEGIGLYGFDGGVQSFGLNVNGKAFFGASGHGQILIDGSSGEITSANYKINDCGLNLDLDDGILTAKGPVITTGTKKTQSMVLIDPLAGGDYDSRPFFRISDHLGNDLMKVGYGVYKLQNSLYDEGKVGMQLDFNRGTLKAKSEAGTDDQGHEYKSSFVMIDGSGNSGSFFRIYDGKAQKDIFYAGGSQLQNAAGTRRITDSDTITVKTDAEVQKVMDENISNPVRAAKDPNVTTAVKPNKVEGDLAYITIIKTSRTQDDYTGGSVKYPVTTGDQAGKLESITSSECKISRWKTLTTTYTITIDMKKIKSIDLGEGAVLDFRKPFCRDQVRDLKDKTVYGQEVVSRNPDKIIALTNRDGLTNTSETVDSGTNFTIRHTYYKKTAVTDIKNGTFFLQSSNYGGNESEEVNRLGMKIDLSEGSIAIYDKNATGGYVKLSSKASEFFKIVCVKDGSNQTLITAGESQFYLKSFNYSAPTITNETVTDEDGSTHTDRKITSPGSGLKIDLRSNTIEGYDVLIHTTNGSDTSKYIKIDSGAQTYPLRIGANFRVNWNGDIYAKDGYFVDGHFSGVLESNEGHIGGFLITATGIKDAATEGARIDIQSSGNIFVGSNKVRLYGDGYILIGDNAEIQLNGVTGAARFSGDVWLQGEVGISGNVYVAGTMQEGTVSEGGDAGPITNPSWQIDSTNGLTVNKGVIGGWKVVNGTITSSDGDITLSSAGAGYIQVGKGTNRVKLDFISGNPQVEFGSAWIRGGDGGGSLVSGVDNNFVRCDSAGVKIYAGGASTSVIMATSSAVTFSEAINFADKAITIGTKTTITQTVSLVASINKITTTVVNSVSHESGTPSSLGGWAPSPATQPGLSTGTTSAVSGITYYKTDLEFSHGLLVGVSTNQSTNYAPTVSG